MAKIISALPRMEQCIFLAPLAFFAFIVASPSHAGIGKVPLETAGVMAPLEINTTEDMKVFERHLGQAKAIGVDLVSVDVWWGKIEAKGDQQFDWSYYDTIFGKIRQSGLKIVPILSFHKCGGGPGDDCNIPLPSWLYSKFADDGLTATDLKYESETGTVQDDALVPWVSGNGSVLDQYRQVMAAFSEHYAPIAKDMVEVNISLGPTGELRYPAYNVSDGWKFPARGFFQSYSAVARSAFRNWALEKFGGVDGVAKRWGIPLHSADEIRVPGGELPTGSGARADSFVAGNDYLDTQYGKDFVDWYNGSLVAHGKRMMLTADRSLTGMFASVPLGMKVPGIHWQILPCSPHPRIAEVTAGLVQSSLNLGVENAARTDAFGYKAIVDMVGGVKKDTGRDVILHFTASEMDNEQNCGQGNSLAKALVFWISHGAEDRGITHKSENALSNVDADGDNRTWDNIRNAFTYAPYSGFTLLRMSDQYKTWDTDKEAYRKFIRDFR